MIPIRAFGDKLNKGKSVSYETILKTGENRKRQLVREGLYNDPMAAAATERKT